MEALDAIFTRRSIRKYDKDHLIEPEKIETLLKAAMTAPSTANQQPWHFIVIDKRELLDQIPEVHPYAKMCLLAPLAIVGCVDLELDTHVGFWPQDLSNATMNILTAARALDLGAVWLGVYPREDRVEAIGKLFGLPENVKAFNIIPIGYTDMPQNAMERRFLPERVHYNRW